VVLPRFLVCRILAKLRLTVKETRSEIRSQRSAAQTSRPTSETQRSRNGSPRLTPHPCVLDLLLRPVDVVAKFGIEPLDVKTQHAVHAELTELARIARA